MSAAAQKEEIERLCAAVAAAGEQISGHVSDLVSGVHLDSERLTPGACRLMCTRAQEAIERGEPEHAKEPLARLAAAAWCVLASLLMHEQAGAGRGSE